MEVEVLRKDDFSITLKVKGVPLHILNAYRRAIIAEVPTMAIDYVVFTENSSVFYDEYIAHRLGLVPLTSDEALDKYLSPEECAEAGERGIFSTDCFVKMELEAEGPSEEGKVLVVYSGDLKTSDPLVKPAYGNIPIVKLIKGQKIRLEAYARLGRGREHIKWSPVSVAAHKYVPSITINSSICKGPQCSKCAEICPKGVLAFNGETLVVKEGKLLECSLCKLCENACPSGAIKVSWVQDEYVLKVELVGSLGVGNVLLKPFDILSKKLDAFMEELKRSGVVYVEG